MAIFKIGDVVQGDGTKGTKCMTVVGVVSDGYVTCSYSENGDIHDTIWHESSLRIANYPAGNVSHLRKFSAGVELGSRPADLNAALAEIERLIVELADVKRNAVARCNVVAICDDYERDYTSVVAERGALSLEVKRLMALSETRLYDLAYVADERDDLARRLADAENEIAALRDGVRIAAIINDRDAAMARINELTGVVDILGSERADLAYRLAETESDLAAWRARCLGLLAAAAQSAHQPYASQRQVANLVAVSDQAPAAGVDEVLSDFWDYCSNDVAATLPIGVQRAWLVPQMDGIKAIVARQPADDLAIPPVPFNALRWSR